MTTLEYFKLQFKKKEYRIDMQKLIYVLSCLESRRINDISNSNIKTLLKKYGLLDKMFLDNINKV